MDRPTPGRGLRVLQCGARLAFSGRPGTSDYIEPLLRAGRLPMERRSSFMSGYDALVVMIMVLHIIVDLMIALTTQKK